MMKVNCVADILAMPAAKTESPDCSGDFAQEMNKAVQTSQNEKPLEDGVPQDAKGEEDEMKIPPSGNEDQPEMPENEKTEKSEMLLATPPVILPNAIVPAAPENTGEQTLPEKALQVAPELQQQGLEVNAKPKTQSLNLPVEEAAKTPEDAEAVSFAKQALNEANAMLGKSIDSEENPHPKAVLTADAPQENMTTEDAPKATALPADEKSGMSERDKNKGAEESGKYAGEKQTPVTAPLRSDGKVEFQLSRTQLDQLEPVSHKESMLTRVIDQVKSTVANEKTEFFLQLKPEHLGGLSILLSADGKGVAAKLMTSNHDVQQVLQSDLNQLQAALREKGINVVHMEVIYNQNAGFTARDNREESRGQENTFSHVHGGTGDSTEDAAAFYDNLSYYDVLAEQGGSVEFSA